MFSTLGYKRTYWLVAFAAFAAVLVEFAVAVDVSLSSGKGAPPLWLAG